MKKILTVTALISALLLTTGCAAANMAQDGQIAVMAAAGSDAAGEAAPITTDDAQAIALTHAGVSASKAANVKVEYDKEDGRYDVDFRYNNYEYDYEIHHTSGKVISHDKEYEAPPEKATEKPTEKAAESSKIGKDKAKSIALKHAGLSASDVRELQVEYDKDDGVPVYEVEFESGNREYSYEIHAETGKIRSHEIDD